MIQRLRMQLIDKKIDDEVEINKLKKNNKKLVKEIAKHKLAETELKHKAEAEEGNRLNYNEKTIVHSSCFPGTQRLCYYKVSGIWKGAQKPRPLPEVSLKRIT